MVPIQMPDVLCPNCLEKGGLDITKALAARPVGLYDTEGSVLKFALAEVPRLYCYRCEWAVLGKWDGPNYAIFPDPHP